MGHAKCDALISLVVRKDMLPTHTKGSAEYSVYKTMMAISPPCRRVWLRDVNIEGRDGWLMSVLQPVFLAKYQVKENNKRNHHHKPHHGNS